MQLKIIKVYRSWKDKEGTSLKTKDGREFERVAIKVNEYGDKWVSGFGGFWNKDWKEGDTINVDVEEKGQYLNFKRIDPVQELRDVVFGLEKRVLTLEMGGTDKPSPKREDLEDIPVVEEELTEESPF